MNQIFTLLLLCAATTQVWAQPARTVTQAVNFVKLANTLRALDRPQQAIPLLERALPVLQKDREQRYAETIAHEVLGLAYNEAENPSKSLNHLQKALAGYKKLNYYASAWALNELIRNITNKNTYAGIQITSSAMKVAIFRTRLTNGFYEKDITARFDVPVMVAKANQDTRAALRIALDSARRYNVPGERIFVVLGSEVKRSADMAAGGGAANLYERLSGVLPKGVQPIDTTLTPGIEAELFTVGAVPRLVWPSTSALELSNGGTMGGYFDEQNNFHAMTLPIGPYTLVGQIEPKRPLGIDAFKREAQRVITAIADTALTAKFLNNGKGLQQRRTVGVGGDIAMALVATLHPEKAGITAVPITADDVDRFKDLALNNFDGLMKPDLKNIPNALIRQQAIEELNTVRALLTEKQVIAGALWLDAVMKAYSAQSPAKRFVFIRNSDIGWVTGRFLQTLNQELDGTIAKGAKFAR